MPRKNKHKLKFKMPKLPFKKLGIVIFIVIVILLVFLFRDVIFSAYPEIIMRYKMRYNQMATPEYLEELRAFVNGSLILIGKTQEGKELMLSLNDSIAGLNYVELLKWERRHLIYWGGDLQIRPEMPIEILTTNIVLGKDYFVALGRCGEFALLYNGLLLANGYRSRIVVDCSVKTDNRVAGDHVWNEVWINETWLHVDPTENVIGSPDMYANPNKWNKCVNLVYAIEFNQIVDVTNNYR